MNLARASRLVSSMLAVGVIGLASNSGLAEARKPNVENPWTRVDLDDSSNAEKIKTTAKPKKSNSRQKHTKAAGPKPLRMEDFDEVILVPVDKAVTAQSASSKAGSPAQAMAPTNNSQKISELPPHAEVATSSTALSRKINVEKGAASEAPEAPPIPKPNDTPASGLASVFSKVIGAVGRAKGLEAPPVPHDAPTPAAVQIITTPTSVPVAVQTPQEVSKVAQQQPKSTPAVEAPVAAKNTDHQSIVEKASQKPAIVAPKQVNNFSLTSSDKSIRAGVERWAKSQGYRISWEVEQSSTGGIVQFDATLGDDFEFALSKLFGTLRIDGKAPHAYLYEENHVTRIVLEAGPPEVFVRADDDKNLLHVTKVKGFWLGAGGVAPASPLATATSLPSKLTSAVSLTFADKSTIGAVVETLGREINVPIFFPKTLSIPAFPIFKSNEIQGGGKKVKHGRATYNGTPRELLDRITDMTAITWEFKDNTVVFTQ